HATYVMSMKKAFLVHLIFK
ncbi:unnamed protein product, partial [Allacma fusca]